MKLRQTQKLNMRTDYPNLDLAKIVCALLVVVIHTSPLDNTSALAGFYLGDVIARIAVPLFLLSPVFCFFAVLRLKMAGLCAPDPISEGCSVLPGRIYGCMLYGL